jgi:O-acetyl-ADP-ribose deacetylase (regulator of RNase III)
MPKYLFFDIDAHLLEAYDEELNGLSNVEVCSGPTDIRDLSGVASYIDAYVSPANSYGWMNGGIDAIYSQMFPFVQARVQDKIGRINPSPQSVNKPFLPVGSATIVTVSSRDNTPSQLICAPTMEMPMSIAKKPENIYYAMYAILKVTQYLPKNFTVAIPGLGTGVGRVPPTVSAQYIRKAFDDFYAGVTPKYPNDATVTVDKQDTYLVKFD